MTAASGAAATGSRFAVWGVMSLAGDGTPWIEALDVAALGAGRRVDDGIDQRRLSRRECLAQSLGEAGRVGHVITSPAERLDDFLVARVAEEAGRRVGAAGRVAAVDAVVVEDDR